MIKNIAFSAILCFLVVGAGGWAYPSDLNGVWTKTTLPDPANITVIYQETTDIKAVGCSQIGGKTVVWYAVGEFKGYPLRLRYHYSAEAIPPGWEQDGVMILDISEDGKTLSGVAVSSSGDWSSPVIFKRIR